MVKNPPAIQETQGSIPGLRRSPGGGHGNPLQYSCLENPMDRGVIILEPPKIKFDTVSTVSPSISHEVMGPDAVRLDTGKLTEHKLSS